MLNCFTFLPDELIVKIFKNLPQKYLASSAQVDKRFRRIADDDDLKPNIKVADLRITCKLHFFSVHRNSKVVDLKQKIESKLGIKVNHQKILFASKEVADDKKIHGFDMSFVHLV